LFVPPQAEAANGPMYESKHEWGIIMKKLIFFDIDGTIITEGARHSDRYIPQSCIDTIRQLQANGHLCFVNTGRSYAEIDPSIQALPFDGYVCGCGTYILYREEELFARHIEYSLGNAIVADMETCRLEWLLEGCTSIYYSTAPYRTRIRDFQAEHKVLIPDAFRSISPETAGDLDFDKFCICLGEGHDFNTFRLKYQDRLTFIDRGHGFYEIMPQGCSKASGIRFLEEYFQIPHKDTIAIGDSTNDLPMLKYAGYSIAMGNSPAEILPAVSYVTDTVENDGVYKAMKHLNLI